MTACTNSLDVSAPTLHGTTAAVCESLRDASPESVAGQPRRHVSSDGVALAWGRPAIVLRCGTTDAVGLGPTSTCHVVDGVGWYAEDLGAAYRFTTIDREVPVEVTVPAAYAPEGGPLLDLAAPVKAADPVAGRCR